MKLKTVFPVLFFGFFLIGKNCLAQTPAPYPVPGDYRFDYAVDQSLTREKNPSDTTLIHFFYTGTGDYAAAVVSAKFTKKGNLFIILTRDGMVVVLDEHKKDITIINSRKISADLMGLTKWIRIDSLMAHMRKNPDGNEFQSVKTGRTGIIGNYVSEEYHITGSRGTAGSVWCAKVDFPAGMDYLMNATGGGWLKMMAGQQTTHPLMQALMQPKALLTDMELKDSAGKTEMQMRTLSIRSAKTIVTTAGYTINDYSHMTMPEIFQAEMKKRNQ